MKYSVHMRDGITIFILSVAIPCVLFAFSLSSSGERDLGALETIHGIEYPKQEASTVILEDMAHTDLFLEEPVLAKQVKFTIGFEPGNAESIDIGVRDNAFWLSYIKYPLYRKGIDSEGIQTKQILIPLSTALADTDRSVDVMIFTKSAQGMPQWRIQDIRASVEFDMPSMLDTKAYVKSVLTRERII
ncbi:MAG: hypothetical protein O3A36_03110 [bacterium]|nr:hypothetical protein [bacterium]